MPLVVAAARQQRRSSRGTQRAAVHTGIIVGANGRLTRQPMGCAREYTLRRSRPAQSSGLRRSPRSQERGPTSSSTVRLRTTEQFQVLPLVATGTIVVAGDALPLREPVGLLATHATQKLASLRHGCLKCLCTKLGYGRRGSGACNRTAGQNEAWLVNRFSICKKQERPRLGDDNLVRQAPRRAQPRGPWVIILEEDK